MGKKPKKQQKANPEGFTKTKTKNSRTETVSVPPKTPEKSMNMSFSNMSSPASTIFEIDDHPNVSPIKTDLLGLFSAPTQVISLLKSTPKKRKLNDAERETFIVIEDQTLNAQLNSGSRSEPCLKKDSNHLVLPNVATVQEGKNHSRFLAPPSSFQTTNDAAIVRSIRSQTVGSKDYKGSVILYGYDGVKKEERAVLPGGTVYYFSAFWKADPHLSFNFAQETQTELSLLPVNMIDTDTNIERQETQTVDRNSVGINITMNTEEVSTSTETVCVNKQTQT